MKLLKCLGAGLWYAVRVVLAIVMIVVFSAVYLVWAILDWLIQWVMG